MERKTMWLVWENSGRWGAALRTAIARQKSPLPAPSTNPQIRELRHLAEMTAAMREHIRPQWCWSRFTATT